METEVTVAVRALVRWHLEDGKPVIDGVEVIGHGLADVESVRDQLAAITNGSDVPH